MERSALAFRMFFLFFVCLVTSVFEVTTAESDHIFQAIFFGVMKGGLLFLPLFLCEMVMRTFSLYLLRRLLFGVAVGTMVGFVLASVCNTVFSLLNITSSSFSNLSILFVYLASLYVGIVVAMAKEEKWQLALSFLKPALPPTKESQQGNFLADVSALEDSRFFDLAKTGMLDSKLIVPTFIIKEIQNGLESSDEAIKVRCRKAYEQLKKLEALPKLKMQYKDCIVSALDDSSSKLVSAAKDLNAALITCGEVILKPGDEQLITLINLEAVANAVKPSAQRGEVLSIKIQRPGKEPKQGVGYLDDGTMVVVNGGGDFLGEMVKVQVLSQKYSTSGKIIFCNALSEDGKVPAFKGISYFTVDENKYTSSPYGSLSHHERREEVSISPHTLSGFSSPEKRKT